MSLYRFLGLPKLIVNVHQPAASIMSVNLSRPTSIAEICEEILNRRALRS